MYIHVMQRLGLWEGLMPTRSSALIDKQQRASGVGIALPPFTNTYGKSFFYTKLKRRTPGE